MTKNKNVTFIDSPKENIIVDDDSVEDILQVNPMFDDLFKKMFDGVTVTTKINLIRSNELNGIFEDLILKFKKHEDGSTSYSVIIYECQYSDGLIELDENHSYYQKDVFDKVLIKFTTETMTYEPCEIHVKYNPDDHKFYLDCGIV